MHTNLGYEAYCLYNAIRLHFSTDYDFFKYNGKTNSTIESYKRRKDFIFFEMLGKKPDVKHFIAYNFAHHGNPYVWIKDLSRDEQYQLTYVKIKKLLDSLGYMITGILELVVPERNLVDYLKVNNQQHPQVVKDFLANKIDITTLALFFIAFPDLLDRYNKQIDDKIIWPSISNKVKKLIPFLQVDRSILTAKLKQHFMESL